ncbi:Protein of unknown function [Jiangella sp. DSM 45060]|nr:Protein of unknown function [Jiangella sp. DSM 45060]
MSAVVIDESDLPRARAFLASLRSELGRAPGQTMHWRNVKHHPERLHVAKSIGAQDWMTVSNVVVCKRALTASTQLNDDQAYLYTFRFLLERLSWLARDQGAELKYTLAHIRRFKLAKLRDYEERLRRQPDGACKIAWPALDPAGGSLDQPSRNEYLQLADSVASATALAFEKDRFGNTEQRYLQELAPLLYRRGSAPLTSYGLKLHPYNDMTKAAYPWVAAL